MGHKASSKTRSQICRKRTGAFCFAQLQLLRLSVQDAQMEVGSRDRCAGDGRSQQRSCHSRYPSNTSSHEQQLSSRGADSCVCMLYLYDSLLLHNADSRCVVVSFGS